MTSTAPTIAEQIVTINNDLASRAPAEVTAPFAAEQANLDAAGIPPGVPTPPAPLPDGDLLDVHGDPTTLALARAGKPAVIVFYRGAWCPYCNVALSTYQTQLVPALAEQGVQLIAISPQKPDGSMSAKDLNDLTYTVISDPGNQIAAALDIVTEPTSEAAASQVTLGLDIATVNADGTRRIPMPTTLIVDADGIIRWIDVHPNYTSRSEVSDILAAVRATLS